MSRERERRAGGIPPVFCAGGHLAFSASPRCVTLRTAAEKRREDEGKDVGNADGKMYPRRGGGTKYECRSGMTRSGAARDATGGGEGGEGRGGCGRCLYHKSHCPPLTEFVEPLLPPSSPSHIIPPCYIQARYTKLRAPPDVKHFP